MAIIGKMSTLFTHMIILAAVRDTAFVIPPLAPLLLMIKNIYEEVWEPEHSGYANPSRLKQVKKVKQKNEQ